MAEMIWTENLTKMFNGVLAVDSVTMRVKEGEIFGLLGPNGAGKTTTIRMLSCLIANTSGIANVAGYDIGNKSEQPKIRKIVGVLTENVGLYEELSAYDNLDFYGRFYKLGEQARKERIEYLLKMLGLWERKEEAAGRFSKGMKQKLAIARALVHDPQVLFLDEPTANLDPEASKTVRDFIVELKKEKRTIFLNTHLLEEAEKICDRVAILKTKLITIGTPEELRNSLSNRKVKVQLQKVNNSIVSAVERLGYDIVETTANSIVINLKEPEKENPAILRAIQDAGGRVVFVTEVGSSLEDVYLKIVRGE
jgi:ABC-2 type transport system ATP-binding protein